MRVKTKDDKPVFIDTSLTVGTGAEGSVYKLSESVCAKILNKPDPSIEEKILKMLSYKGKGLEKVAAWPMDALYNDTGAFIGYTMPYIKSEYYLFSLLRDEERKQLFSEFSRRFAIRLMYNLASICLLFHNHNVVISDWNMLNWILKEDGSIMRLDCDSLQFDKYKCEVLTPELASPEQISTGKSSKESDSFSFAVILFQILTDTHPFGIDTSDADSDPFSGNILKGNCHYLNPDKWPAGIINVKKVYGEQLFNLFKRCFEYNSSNYASKIASRPTMDEWIAALKPFTVKSAFADHCIRCGEDYPNVFLNSCPYCEAEKAFKKVLPKAKPNTPSVKAAAPSVSTTAKPESNSSAVWWIVGVILVLVGLFAYSNGISFITIAEWVIKISGGCITALMIVFLIKLAWPVIVVFLEYAAAVIGLGLIWFVVAFILDLLHVPLP